MGSKSERLQKLSRIESLLRVGGSSRFEHEPANHSILQFHKFAITSLFVGSEKRFAPIFYVEIRHGTIGTLKERPK